MVASQPIEAKICNPPTYPSAASDDDLLSSGSSMDPIMQSDTNLEIKLSKLRWLILIAFLTLGMSNTLCDIPQALQDLSLELIELDIKQFLYLQTFFDYLMAATIFPTSMFVEKYGTKTAFRTIAGLFILIGSARAILVLPEFPYHRRLKMPCYIITCLAGRQMMTMFYMLPLKISETWFSVSERSVAWALMGALPSLANAISSFVYPRLIAIVDDLRLLAYVNITAVLFNAFITLVLVRRSEPKHPTSERMIKAKRETPKSFKESIVKMTKHPAILIHLIHICMLDSISWSVGPVMQPILKSMGETEIFISNFLTINSVVSTMMLIFLAFFVHKIRYPTLTCKLSSLVQGTLFLVSLYPLIKPQPTWVLITISIILIISKSWTSPNNNNMTAQLASGTVSQPTIVGIAMLIEIITNTIVKPAFTQLIVIVNKEKTNYERALIFLATLAVINEMFYLIFFHGDQAKKVNDEDEQGASVTRFVRG